MNLLDAVRWGGGIYYGEWWITWRCTDTQHKQWREVRWNQRGVVKRRSALAVADSGLWIAAVKAPRFYLFIVVLLKRWWRSGYVPAPQFCYMSCISLWNMSVNNIISLLLTCTLSHSPSPCFCCCCCCHRCSDHGNLISKVAAVATVLRNEEVTVLFPWRSKCHSEPLSAVIAVSLGSRVYACEAEGYLLFNSTKRGEFLL